MHDQHGHEGHEHEKPTFEVHGMLLFGEDPFYFSHLPMFAHIAHRFQSLMEIEFRDDVRDAIRADMKAAGDTIYTFVPEAFDILKLDPFTSDPSGTRIKGTVVRGHFERGGRPILEDVVATVIRVTYFRALDPQAHHDDSAPLTYLCFGRAGGLHLAHEISARPDFDQILTVRLVPGTIRPPQDEPDLQTPVAVTFTRTDTPARRLRAGERAEGAFFVGFTRIGERRFTAEVEVGREIYMETGDLR